MIDDFPSSDFQSVGVYRSKVSISCWQRTDGCCFFNNNFIYQRDREREAGNYAERGAVSLPGAQYGTRSQTPGSHPELKAEAQPLSHPGIPDPDF